VRNGSGGIVTLPHEERDRTMRGTDFHAAATASRHVQARASTINVWNFASCSAKPTSVDSYGPNSHCGRSQGRDIHLLVVKIKRLVPP
jgi:hypothetical protein